MKNYKTLLGIAALIAVIVFSLASCVIDVPDNHSLNGTWKRGNGDTVRISGSSGEWRQFGSYNNYWKDAQNKGYIYIGGPAFQNLEQTDALKWKGQQRGVYYTGNVANSPYWSNCTITMSEDGKTFRNYTPGFNDPNDTWTRQ
jgi:hypothetical protein